MFRRLEVALLLAVALLIVPAIARATQQLVPSIQSAQPSGFSRSCDAPPDRVQAAAPLTVAAIGPVPATDGAAEPSCAKGPSPRPADDLLPAADVVSPPRSLRAPPSSLA